MHVWAFFGGPKEAAGKEVLVWSMTGILEANGPNALLGHAFNALAQAQAQG